ncbi:ferric enterobactin receptor precursor [mine drainage metagenome]|uniref:Ferric enterobactin receptor n=1 Tax=mine drainage metagenome TaxID=410659 RepID=A0A1J5RFC4_9ZZZZ
MGIDATIDMRGFGATGTSNTLILVDGQRINPIDMGSIIWSSIPKDSIERIEIIHGAGAVLYGNGATGGVINIITDKSGASQASATASLGSYGYKAADVQLTGGSEQGYIKIFAHDASADGYRQNSGQKEESLSGRAGFYIGTAELFTDYTFYHDSARLPGSLGSIAYAGNPRGTNTPDNSQNRDGYRIRPGISYRINDRLTFDAEVAREHQDLQSSYVSSSYFSDRIRDTTSLTPRLRWRHDLGGLPSETVVGMDFYDGTVTATNQGGPNQGAAQTSFAYYLQNITRLNDNISLTLGGREQRMKQNARQNAYAAWASPAMNGEGTRSQSAYDASLAYATDNWRVYGKTGTTFRFANTDELFGSDVNGNPVFSGDLRPQHGTINEVGGNLGLGPVKLRASLYRLELTDEIGYDPAGGPSGFGANVNLAPTRRDGLETEADWKITDSLSTRLAYTYIDASFRSGSYAGNELSLVPHQQVSLQGVWDSGWTGKYSALVRHVGNRRYDGDFTNTAGMLSGYTTIDLQGGWDLKSWQITAKLLNALDRKYAPYAGYYGSGSYAYYPADGRAAYVSASYKF